MPHPPLPAYEQVKAFIKAQINAGHLRPGDAVPSEAVLQQQFGLSRMTVNRAMTELAAEGLLTRIRGSGTVVAQWHRISSTLAVRDIQEEVVERGHRHSCVVLTLEIVSADAALAQALRVRSGAKVFHSVMVHYEDGVPIQLEDRHVNPAAAPDYLQVDFQTTTPTQYLFQCAPLSEARYSIEAALPTKQEAKALGIKASEPCLVITRCTISGAHVASQGRLVYPGMRYHLQGNFQL
jgi:GntR family histidine utilization transcriptional repressor